MLLCYLEMYDIRTQRTSMIKEPPFESFTVHIMILNSMKLTLQSSLFEDPRNSGGKTL